jgi:hypothetical protein
MGGATLLLPFYAYKASRETTSPFYLDDREWKRDS